jgi:hypothetical protein
LSKGHIQGWVMLLDVPADQRDAGGAVAQALKALQAAQVPGQGCQRGLYMMCVSFA